MLYLRLSPIELGHNRLIFYERKFGLRIYNLATQSPELQNLNENGNILSRSTPPRRFDLISEKIAKIGPKFFITADNHHIKLWNSQTGKFIRNLTIIENGLAVNDLVVTESKVFFSCLVIPDEVPEIPATPPSLDTFYRWCRTMDVYMLDFSAKAEIVDKLAQFWCMTKFQNWD